MRRVSPKSLEVETCLEQTESLIQAQSRRSIVSDFVWTESLLWQSIQSPPIMGLGFIAGAFGVLLLAHASYSTIQYRELLKIMDEEFSGPPIDVMVELFMGFIFCISAALTVPGKFLSIHPDSEENRIVSASSNLDFMIFNHRGKLFPLEVTKLKH